MYADLYLCPFSFTSVDAVVNFRFVYFVVVSNTMWDAFAGEREKKRDVCLFGLGVFYRFVSFLIGFSVTVYAFSFSTSHILLYTRDASTH